MEEKKSILHELYVYSEWKPEPEYIQKSDSILPENISALWRWLKFFGPKKSLIDNITAHKERQQKWHIALGDEGKVIAVLTDNILEIRTKRSEYATIAARTTVSRDSYPQWRKLVWSPDCSFIVVAYGNGVVSFFDLTASNLFNIPIDCSRPGGLECTDNTHAVADIIFMPLRVKDNKWNWEVLIVNYDGKLRGYIVSQTDGYKLQHTFHFTGGVGSVTHCALHSTLYVAGLPRGPCKDPSSPLTAGITAWRILNDDPFYKLSVVSDELEAQLAGERFQIYIPFVSAKNLAFIVSMVLSPDCTKMACLHCNGDVTIWRLPVLKLLYRWPLLLQPGYELRNPLQEDQGVGDSKNNNRYLPAGISWWTNEEVILSRFSGAVTVCHIQDLVNVLGKKPEFFQGAPQVTSAHDGTFMVLECESNVLPAKKSHNDDSMEVVKAEEVIEDTMLELTKELVKSVLYTITDIETFQPKPRKITIVSRIYRLLGVKSTTPDELFSRKIESGNYTEALTLADTFHLDSDLVYQQQWRKNPVSTDAIHQYLSKVSKKIWAVHQCVDRLPETLPAAKELIQFGLELTNSEVLNEINKDRSDESRVKDPDAITPEDLNAYTSELLRCRHVMLFNKERLRLYEAILRCEKSTYVKDEYDRLRSNSIVHSSMEIAKEGRIQALICLWPYIKTVTVQMAVLEKLPETINPLEYQNLLPIKKAMEWFEKKSPIKMLPDEHANDWCRKEIFSSNWSEESTPEAETSAAKDLEVSKWYEKRAREIEDRSGQVQNALTLVTLATVGGAVEGLDEMMFHLLTLDTLIYDINVEDVTLKELEKLSTLDTCKLLMKMSTPATFVSDLKVFVIPFLKRFENLSKRNDACLSGLTEYLESVSVDDLSPILLVLKSPSEFELDVRTHLELAERCIFAYSGTEQLDKACDLLNTILKETDGSISMTMLVRRVRVLEGAVWGSVRACWRGVHVPARRMHALAQHAAAARAHLADVARVLPHTGEKPTPADWDKLLKDFLELQSTLFTCVTKEECYEIYASALLKSGDLASIRLATDVLTCESGARRNSHLVNYTKSIELVLEAAKQYFSSASSLTDPNLEMAKCCLLLIKDANPEIQQELDMIAALPILNSFNLDILPLQVSLCEDRMTLIEDCLKLDPNAYLASHKLLKLAALLKIAGDDERLREGLVLHLVGKHAVAAGDAGSAAATHAALRLAALQHAPAAALLAHVGAHAAPAAPPARAALLAAALTHCPAHCIEPVHRARLELELESLKQMGVSLKEHSHRVDRWPSTEDEFSDAVTTPVVEKKDIVGPMKTEASVPLFNFLLDAFQTKLSFNKKPTESEQLDHSLHCQEFYRTLYPDHDVSDSFYKYDRFSMPDETSGHIGHAVLKWFYIQNCLDDGALCDMEGEVLQKCAEDIMLSDSALAVSCLLRGSRHYWASRRALLARPRRATPAPSAATTPAPAPALLYALLLNCNAPDLRDNVYLAKPLQLARITLKQKNASEEQLELISLCVEQLSALAELTALQSLGYNVNQPRFHSDKEYREEIIFKLARSGSESEMQLAWSLGSKHGIPALELWLQHAAASPRLAPARPPPPPCTNHAYTRIQEALWPQISGSDHHALINLFNILHGVDEKPLLSGLTAAEHVKLLKKAKAASSDLNYKLLVEQPSAEDYTSHILQIAKPENIGMLTKFLRSLPPAFKIPVPVNVVFTKWLVKYFFSIPPASASNKKWMQQYRACSSYFSKLSKEELLEFLEQTCFSQAAVERVPSGTRNLMLMQAVDYCQQEQENEIKFNNKSEQSWSQVGQELTRWARFLENFHSETVQGIIDNSRLAREPLWQEVEMSHGEAGRVSGGMGRVLVAGQLRAGPAAALLHCLHLDLTLPALLHHTALHHVQTKDDIQTLVTRLTQYSKEGIKFPEETLDLLMQKATEYRLPPHKQIGLLSLSQRHQVQDTDDLMKVANITVDLFKTEWSDSDFARDLTEESLMTEEGRRKCFQHFSQTSNSWQRKKALIDVLNFWPATRNNDMKSLQCEYLHSMLTSNADQKENLVLIKLLLRKPLLTDEEVKYLTESAIADAAVNAIWVIILSKSEHSKDEILSLVLKYKDSVENHEIDDDLIKELLDSDMFLKLVPTPIYAAILNYILGKETSGGEPHTDYTVQWASNELLKSGYLAEAGHLQLTAMGVPSALMGFSQSVIYCKNMFKN